VSFPIEPAGQYALQVWWRGDDDLEYFTLRCKNEEQMKQWESAIMKLIRDLQIKRGEKAARDIHGRSISISAQSATSTQTLPPYPGPPGPRGGRYTGYPEEKPPPVPQYPQYASQGPNNYSYYGQNWRNDGFETEEEGYESSQGSGGYGSMYPDSGRGTPIGAANGRRGTAALSMPPERDIAPGYDRERARTGDSAMLAQWSRQHSHNGSLATNGMPPPQIPLSQRPAATRNMSSQSAVSMGSVSGMSDASFGNGIHPRGPSLRSQFSSSRLRSAYGEDGDDRNSGYAQYADSPGGPQQQRMPTTNPNLGPPINRNRSISNPTSYLQAQVPKQPLPPMPLAPQWTGPSQPSAGIDRERIAAGASRERLGGARSQQGMLPPRRRPNSDGSSDYSDESPIAE
jgi:cell division control protein 24